MVVGHYVVVVGYHCAGREGGAGGRGVSGGVQGDSHDVTGSAGHELTEQSSTRTLRTMGREGGLEKRGG